MTSAATTPGLRRSQVKAAIAALRPQQWVKNLLIFAPIVLGHRYRDASLWGQASLGFFAFTALASATYIANDITDRHADRLHPVKRFRPFAAGELTPAAGFWLIAPLLALAALLSLPLPAPAAGTLLTYGIAVFLYSFRLKRIVFLDAVLLALFYCLRILYGGAATQIPISVWTMAFSMFLFLSLALAKRVAELRMEHEGSTAMRRNRAYRPEDLHALSAFGVAAASIAVLVIPLYLQDPAVSRLFDRPWLLWLTCPVLLVWLGRIWILAGRGELRDDPLVYAFTDRVSLATGLLLAPIFLLAL